MENPQDDAMPTGAETPSGDTLDQPEVQGGLAGADQAAARGDTSRELDEQRDKYLRLAAEYDNYRKRSARERQEAAPRAQADLLRQLLDPLDDLSRFAHLDPAQVDAKTVVEGAAMVERKVQKVFAAAGLTTVNPIGAAFDPTQHEAVATEPAATAEEDEQVARVFQVGYVFNGQLLRPARVVVKQWNG